MEGKNGNLNTWKEYYKEEMARIADEIPQEDVLGEYISIYDSQPAIPMMLCSGFDDPEYIAMLRYCLKNKTPVTEEIEEKFFPMEDGAVY